MSVYRKVDPRIWADEKFAALSRPQPCAQSLWLYLLTGPHTTSVPGLFRCGRAALAEELGWTLEDFDKAFAEVLAKGMAKADFGARVLWLPKAIRFNKPESPNVVKGWKTHLAMVPECALKREAVAGLRSALEAVGPAFVQAFEAALGVDFEEESSTGKASAKPIGKPSPKPSGKPSPKTFPKTSPKTLPNQEQEQEQEQEHKQEGARAGAQAPEGAPLCLEGEYLEVIKSMRPDLQDRGAVYANFRDTKPVAQQNLGTWRVWVRRERQNSEQPSPGPRAAASATTVPSLPGRDPALLKLEADSLITKPPSPAIRQRLDELRRPEVGA